MPKQKQVLRIAIIACALVLCNMKLGAQQCPSVIQFNNPSFEGELQMPCGNAPSSWSNCDPYGFNPSTDQHPNNYFCNISQLPASNGQYYVGMGAAAAPISQESLFQQLNGTLIAGLNYSFTMDITSNNYCIGIMCGEIQLYGGNSPCSVTELLWSSGIITDTIWQTHQVSFVPSANYTYLMFSPKYNACGGNCTFLFIDNLSDIQPDVAQAIGGNISCNGLCDGWAKVGYKPGPPPYTYLWNNGATVDSIGGLCPGTYRVDVTNGVGFTSCDTIVITEPLVLQANPLTDSIKCFGDSGIVYSQPLGGTAPFSYLWSNGSTNDSTTFAAGSYFLTVTDANGCQSTNGFIVTEPTPLMVDSFIYNSISCYNQVDGSVYVYFSGGTPPYTYSWQPPISNTYFATNLAVGLYTVTVKDAKNCTLPYQINMLQPLPLQVNFQKQNPTCNGIANGWIKIVPTGGGQPYSYSWSPNVSNTDSAGNLPQGTYLVTVTDARGCVQTKSISLTQPPALVPNAYTFANVKCNGQQTGKAKASASGGTPPYSYLWSNASTNDSLLNVAAGNYSVIITDAQGCSDTLWIIITEPSALVISPQISSVLCYGQSNGKIKLNATGGIAPYLYQWQPNVSNNDSAYNIAAGNYIITIIDGNLCQTIINLSVTQPDSISVTVNQTNVLCYGNNTGSISLNVLGGILPYSYQWMPNVSNTNSAGNLAAGIYNITISDSNNCTKMISVNITEPSDLILSTTSDTSFCDLQNGSAIVTVNGGTFPYTYSWNSIPVQTGATATQLAGGIYTVTVTDANNCSKQQMVTVIGTQNATANAGTDETITRGQQIKLHALPDNVQYSWSPTDGLSCSDCQHPEASPLTTTTYTLTTTDVNGCNAIDSITITVNQVNTLFVPDVFSPNGDGKNDVLFVRGSNIAEVNFAVYDRWGERVFETRDKNFGWDGTYKGKELSGAVFVYYCIGKYNDGSEFKVKGDVSLVR